MAERRMFAKTIIDSDAFLDMPLSTQALYFHLSMRADDDGFINNPKKIQRMVCCSDDDLKLLIAKKFIIPFDSGIVVIKHWRIHNYIRGDRKKPTVYQREKAQLTVKENGAYTKCQSTGIPSDSQVSVNWDTQDRIGKDRIGKDRIGEDRREPPLGEFKNIIISDCEYQLIQDTYEEPTKLIEHVSNYLARTGKEYESHYALIKHIADTDGWAKKRKAEVAEQVEAVPMPEEVREKLNSFLR